MEALQACARSEGGKETLANAFSISSGGTNEKEKRYEEDALQSDDRM